MSIFKKNINKISFEILENISEDILNTKNPIKYHNKYYNNCWNEYQNNIEALITKFHKDLHLIMNTINETMINSYLKKTYNWNNINHNHPLVYLHFRETYTDYKIFNELYNKRELTYRSLKINHLIKQHIDIDDEYIISILNKFQNGIFISLDIKLYVENNITLCEYYDFGFLKLHFFYASDLDKDTKYHLISNIYLITKLIHSFNPIHNINLFYFDTHLTKKFDMSNISEFKYLSSENVNSGSSRTGIELMIWRREEVFKVLIHELIHYLNMDVKHDDKFNQLILRNIGQIKYPVFINETITEIQAQFFHTLYMTIMINLNSDIDKIIDNFKVLYNYELIFSWYQFSKIFEYYSIPTFKSDIIAENFNQSSNIFSYYILKCILTIDFGIIIFNLDHIKKYLLDKSNNCNVNDCLILFEHIKQILNKPPKKLLQKIIKHLETNDNSLRMTIFGFY